MSRDVLDAMADAASSYVDMNEFHAAAGRELAQLTNNEAAYVTAGCAAALSIATLACITGDDPALMDRMPDGTGLRTQVIMHTCHRIPYDPAVRLVGAQIVQIGNALQTFEWELRAAIGPQTAAVLFVAGSHVEDGALSLKTVVDIAHSSGVPVIVDAAAQLPPVSNLWKFSRDLGADLVLFSGGKEIRGPQASGLVVGRKDLIEACAAIAAPHQRLLRAMKVGKEEIAGLLAAVEAYVHMDHESEMARRESVCASWVEDLARLPGISAQRVWPNEAGRPTPRVRVRLELSAGKSTGDAQSRLWDGDPRIAVERIDDASFYITPDTLSNGEESIVIDRITELFSQEDA